MQQLISATVVACDNRLPSCSKKLPIGHRRISKHFSLSSTHLRRNCSIRKRESVEDHSLQPWLRLRNESWLVNFNPSSMVVGTENLVVIWWLICSSRSSRTQVASCIRPRTRQLSLCETIIKMITARPVARISLWSHFNSNSCANQTLCKESKKVGIA